MTNVAYISLTSFAKEKFPAVEDCKKAASIALGLTVARLVALPAAPEVSAEEYWTKTASREADKCINEFNENFVVNVDLALETARGYWMIRYFSAFPCLEGPIGSNGEGEFLLKLSGGMRYVNNDTATFCQTNQMTMIQLMNRMAVVLAPAPAKDDGDHEYRG